MVCLVLQAQQHLHLTRAYILEDNDGQPLSFEIIRLLKMVFSETAPSALDPISQDSFCHHKTLPGHQLSPSTTSPPSPGSTIIKWLSPQSFECMGFRKLSGFGLPLPYII